MSRSPSTLTLHRHVTCAMVLPDDTVQPLSREVRLAAAATFKTSTRISSVRRAPSRPAVWRERVAGLWGRAGLVDAAVVL